MIILVALVQPAQRDLDAICILDLHTGISTYCLMTRPPTNHSLLVGSCLRLIEAFQFLSNSQLLLTWLFSYTEFRKRQF